MREHFVIDPLIGKRQQLLLATQLCRMVLKVSTAKYLFLLQCSNVLLDQQCDHRWRRRKRVLDTLLMYTPVVRATMGMFSCGARPEKSHYSTIRTFYGHNELVVFDVIRKKKDFKC